MGLIARKERRDSVIGEREDFNAVIEGGYSHGERHLYFKIDRIEVPENARVLDDGTLKYLLVGRARNFEDFQIINGEADGLESQVSSLCLGGFVLELGIPVLEKPRALCMRDGRIYIEESMKLDRAYLEVLSSVVQTAGEIFGDEIFSELYEKVTRQRV